MKILAFTLLVQAICAWALPSLGPDNYDLSVRANADPEMFQDIVTWDEYSFKVNGERIMVFSGEFHPWRLPSPSLWLDVLHKVKAIGFNVISIYINWSLIEGTKGTILMEGIFSYDEFFKAALEAGLYVIVRPGPYINAELSAGGFPGWRFHAPEGTDWRVDNQGYFSEIKLYWDTVAKLIEPHQITNGGSVILVQLENELSNNHPAPLTKFPPLDYMRFLQETLRDGGIVVPTFHNDVSHKGVWSDNPYPDIYAYDNYPLSCGALEPDLSQDDWDIYLNYSSYDPHFVAEFTDGFYDQNGGIGYNNASACPTQFEPGITRIYYTNLYSMSVNALSLYMIYGGTNWGHMHWDKIYTSYDFRAAIAEDRTITREKYAEIKLEAQFLRVSPALRTSRLTTKASSERTGQGAVVTTQTKDDKSDTSFWTTRHTTVTDTSNVTYTLSIPTSKGNVTIPELGGKLSLSGYDAKIHVSDYSFGDRTILYSSADILSWQKIGDTHVLILYGQAGETHETAFITRDGGSGTSSRKSRCSVLEGSINACRTKSDVVTVNFNIGSQSIVQVDDNILLYVLERNEAYQFWFPQLPTGSFIPTISNDTVIVKGPYLVRTAVVEGRTLTLTGDLNATTEVEVIASPHITNLRWNGKHVHVQTTVQGTLRGTLNYNKPIVSLPKLSKLPWKFHDSLPEISPQYDDSKWLRADNKTSVNGARNLTTPTDLYAGTYGYHVGNFLYRGNFTAQGDEKSIDLEVHGGMASGFSVWLNGNFVGSANGSTDTGPITKTFEFGKTLKKGSKNVIVVISENRGYNENESGGVTYPRGILDYGLGSSNATSISWKITGNLGGEHYADKTRGPQNEGGFYAERMGWHQPEVPTHHWETKSPLQGASEPGVEFYTASFDLDLTDEYDLPIYVELEGTADVRVQFFINGYKFGRYIENIGPQTRFPVHQGVINHKGKNTIAVILWNINPSGGKLTKLSLGTSSAVQWGYKSIDSIAQPVYKRRAHVV